MKKSLLMKIAAGVLIFTSTVATAFASNDARPGDVLFTVDRAIENLQLALTTDDDREAELKLQFAQERLQEVSELIEEFRLEQEAQESEDDSTAGSTTATSTTSTTATTTPSNTNDDTSTSTNTTTHALEVEADVFTDITIVKVELRNGTKEIFETTEKTREGVVDEIVTRFALSRDEIESVLSFEIEDRASRADDRRVGGSGDDGDVDDDTGEVDDNNIALATSVALEFLEEIKADFVLSDDVNAIGIVDDLFEGFEERLNDLPDNVSLKMDIDQNKDRVRFEIKKDGRGDDKIRLKVDKNKIELRDGDNRIKIKVKKDGRVRIETRNKDTDDDSDNHDEDDDSSSDDSVDDDTDDDNGSDNSQSNESGSDNDTEDTQDYNSDDGEGKDDESSDQSVASVNSDNLKIKAEIKKGKTKVEVKISDDKDKFTLDTVVRYEVIDYIAATYGISTSSVESVIDFDED